MLGDELEDLSEDLSGFPLASRIGVEEVRETEGLRGGVGEGRGEERGKGTAALTGWSKEETNFVLRRRRGT